MSYNRSKLKNKIISTTISALLIIVVGVMYSATDGSFSITPKEFDTSQDFVRILDVGQGDSILIYSNGYSALIDTGIETYANDICEQLDGCKIKTIDVMLISHLHSDHTGGISGICERFNIDNAVLPEISVESEGLGSAELLINTVTKGGGNVYTATQGMNFKIGEFEITVLASFDKMSDENNRSLMVCAQIGNRKFIFTGDAEVKAENALLAEGLDLKCDVFKAGHHGSSTSNSEPFLKAMRPRYVAISVGKDNMYGHPHNEVLADFEALGAEIYRTDRNGDITFYINNGSIKAETER